MIVYSEKVAVFIRKLKLHVKEVLQEEMGLKISGERFYNREKTHSYPISIVIFDHKKVLGYFDPEFYELGFHLSLMQATLDDLKNVIRHELAHYYVHMVYGLHVPSHGVEFREVCLGFGWNETVFHSFLKVDFIEQKDQETEVLRKVKKLLALSGSSNAFEAELAILKARELLLKNNLKGSLDLDDEVFVMKRILKQTKLTHKLRACGKILETFFVSVVFHSGKNCIYLEVLGGKPQVEIAEYVAGFLDKELDHLWSQAQLENPLLHGLVAKNSFYLGVAQGYCNKLQTLAKQECGTIGNALILLNSKIAKAKKIAYDRLKTKRAQGRFCPESSKAGQSKGESLTIQQALQTAQKKTLYLK